MTRLPKWGGRKAAAWTAAVLANSDRRCALRLEGCTGVATEGDHIKPRHDYPWLQYDVANGRPACRSCNAKRGRRELRAPATVDVRSFFETRGNLGEGLRTSPPRSVRKDGAEDAR